MGFIKVNLNTVKSVLKEYEIPSSELKAFTKVVRAQILDEVQMNLIKLARTKLNSSKAAYIAGIRRTPNEIYLVGFLPNAVESGLSPFDMKQGFASSPKAKRSKSGGWYLTIPFRIGTPNSSGMSFPAMPPAIYNAIKAGKKPNTSNYPPGSRAAVTDSSTGRVWEQYSHKASIFEGIQSNFNPLTNKNTYNTFRRVSDKSSANSWIHTGITAHNLLDTAWRDTDVNKIIDDNIDALL